MSILTIKNNEEKKVSFFDISIFEIDKEKQLVNLTKICQYFGKNINQWKRLPNTKRFFRAFFFKNPECDNYIVVNGGDFSKGTWGSRRIALKLAEWISVDFEVWANEQLDTLLQTGKVELKSIAPEPKSIVELLKQNNIWLETLSAENTELKIVVKDTSKQLEESKAEVIKLAPKAEFVDKTFTNGQTGLSTMKTVAHECGIKIIPLYKLLREKNVWFYQLNEHAQMENAVMSKYIQSGHFVVKQFWSDRQSCYFDKIFATAKGKLLCWNLIKEGNQSNNQLMDLELA